MKIRRQVSSSKRISTFEQIAGGGSMSDLLCNVAVKCIIRFIRACFNAGAKDIIPKPSACYLDTTAFDLTETQNNWPSELFPIV